MSRLSWLPILEHAAEIVWSYDTGVTLRQLFYRLVADLTLPNTRSYYQRLSSMTAQGRRDGTFPDLLDRVSRIERYRFWESAKDAQEWMRKELRLDRTIGQPWSIYLGVEKAGMSEQLDAWFTEPLGIPHVPLGGYASQSLCDQVTRDALRQRRPAVLIYAGDFDPSGEDMLRDLEKRTYFDKVIRVALNPEQVDEYGLVESFDPEVVAKVERDPRAAAFLRRHGSLVQYELDALPPETLRDLYRNAIDDFWDDSAYRDVLEAEAAERQELWT